VLLGGRITRMLRAITRVIRLPYSLRCLFALITLCALWVGWQTSIVRERQALLNLVQDSGGGAYDLVSTGSASSPPASISFFRKLIGDRVMGAIMLPESLSERRDQIARAFPEADVWPQELFLPADFEYKSTMPMNYSLDTFVERPAGHP